MLYTNLGQTGLQVSRICLGCMSFGNPGWLDWEWLLDEEAATPFFRRAVELGINFFDTADSYSEGRSEEITGRWLKEYAGGWLSYRCPLSSRNVQALLCERGINVTHEALRQWRRKLGQDYANRLRRRRTYPSASRILSRMSRPRIAAVVYGIFREIFCLDFGHF